MVAQEFGKTMTVFLSSTSDLQIQLKSSQAIALEGWGTDGITVLVGGLHFLTAKIAAVFENCLILRGKPRSGCKIKQITIHDFSSLRFFFFTDLCELIYDIKIRQSA